MNSCNYYNNKIKIIKRRMSLELSYLKSISFDRLILKTHTLFESLNKRKHNGNYSADSFMKKNFKNYEKTRKKVNTSNSIKTLDLKPSRNNKGKYTLKCIWSYNTFKKKNKDVNINSLVKQLDKHFPLNSRYKEEEILWYLKECDYNIKSTISFLQEGKRT